ncbi:MAG: c-type cytochrome [Arcobacteraceae bacterium]|nr:c-type cytochrome [Arcobacteraceae bacterium]
MKKLILVTLFAGSLFADGGAIYNGACKTCHGAKAEKVALGKSKVLASLSEAEIVSTMKGYKDGSYGGAMKAVMVPQANKLSDADIAAVAAYVQTIK